MGRPLKAVIVGILILLGCQIKVRLEFKTAQAQVDRLRAEISEIKETLKDTRIKSPLGATAGERQVDAGDYVESGEHLVTIVQTRRLKLSFAVPERFMGRVGPDQIVHIETPAFPGRQFSGKVYFVAPRIQTATRDLPGKAYIDNPDGCLRPGGFATVELKVGRRENAQVVPEEALVPIRTGYGVFRVEDSTARWRRVKIGLRQPASAEIPEGSCRQGYRYPRRAPIAFRRQPHKSDRWATAVREH